MNTKYFAQYFKNNRWETISCYNYKRLCIQEPTKWEHLELKSKPIQGKRYNVHTRSSSSKFCFSGSGPKNLSRNRMTTTHEYITEVISQLKVLNLNINNRIQVEIIPDSIIHEQAKIRMYCTEKKEEIEYIPDLLVRFSNTLEYVKKWGGQIAIEVNVTHSPDDTKRKHFQFLGIPLLEIDANKKLKFKKEGENVTEDDLLIYKKKLEDILTKEIEATLEKGTYTNRYLANRVYFFNKENKELLGIQEKNNRIIERLKQKNEELQNNFLNAESIWNNELKISNDKLNVLNSQFKKYKKRNLFLKILDSIRTSE